MLNVVILVSGGGTNLQAIIDAVENDTITNTKIVGVISNNKNAYALERAKKHGIANCCIAPKDYADRATFNQKFLEKMDELNPDLIVLAGFLVVIPPEMIATYRNRILNIHPSLIPSFEEGDTPEVLQRRVMEQAEWKILPKAIDLIANGKVKVEDGRTHII